MTFKDFFSAQAGDYAKYRPTYPPELFAYLATLTSPRDLAWDCGTGNGQAAVELAHYFTRVIATDPSDKQLEQAEKAARVEYRRAAAELSGLAAASVDLVTAAQAFHWFDQPKFFAEVRRVAKPGAALVVWCYENAYVDSAIDPIVQELYSGILGKYWDAGRRLVEEGYQNEHFPFAELSAPKLAMQREWTAEEMLGYLGTWSALAKYQKEQGKDPLEFIAEKLQKAWGSGTHRVHWPLTVRAFRL